MGALTKSPNKKLTAGACALALWVAAGSTAAQAPAGGSDKPAADAPTERARRDADKVFQMILQHADKPRKARDEKAEKAAAPSAGATRSPVPARTAAAETPAPVAAAKRVAEPPALPTNDTAPAMREEAPAPVVELPKPPAGTSTPAQPPAPGKLELVSTVEPEFPARLMRSLGSGSVVVQFDVETDGRVVKAMVVRSSHKGLNEAATTAVAAWRFKPMNAAATGVVELKFE